MINSDVQLWAAVVGFLLPIVTAVVIRQGWSASMQSVANFVLAAIAAAGTQYFEGNLTGDNWRAYVHTLLIVFVASIASYHGLFRPTNVAPKIEAATGGDPAPAVGSAPPFGPGAAPDVAETRPVR